MYKAFKFRIYSSLDQLTLINKTLGCTRLVYNYYLSKKIEEYKQTHKSSSCFTYIKDLPNLYKKYPFLKEVDSMSLRCTLFDLEDAFIKMYKEHIGYPKYKSKNNQKNSYRTNLVESTYKGHIYQNIKLDLINKTITLPKLKEVKIRGYRNTTKIEGRIINTTISKTNTNKYYVSVLIDTPNYNKKIIPTKIVGIDLGIKDIITTSYGEVIHNDKLINKYEKRIIINQRRLARKIKESKNYYKQKQKLARVYEKLANARKHLIHQITSKLVKENDIIVTEKLKVKEMLQNKRISKQLSNVSFNEIIRQLEYKTKWYYKKLYQVNTYYPSSQICNICDYRNTITKDLNIRKYKCPNCQTELDRDLNASINIMVDV